MNVAFEVSAAALRAEQAALEILANNIANANTPTFKRSDARFAEVLAAQVQTDGRSESAPHAANRHGSGIRTSRGTCCSCRAISGPRAARWISLSTGSVLSRSWARPGRTCCGEADRCA